MGSGLASRSHGRPGGRAGGWSGAPTDTTARGGVGELAAADDSCPVHQHVAYADRVAVGLDVVGAVSDDGGVEDHHIGELAGDQPAAVAQAEVVRRQAGHTPYAFGQGEDGLITAVAAEEPGEGAVGP